MLRLFAYEHLRHADLRALSRRFSDFAQDLVETIPRGPERTVALSKLLEAKDAAVRAVAIPEIPDPPFSVELKPIPTPGNIRASPHDQHF